MDRPQTVVQVSYVSRSARMSFSRILVANDASV